MASNLVLEPLSVPLTRMDNGVYRVTGTRIPLERIVESYKNGATPEGIVDSFDTLRLSDVYRLIGYYLDHREEVERYLREQEEQAEEVRRKIEASQPARPGLKEELLRRKALLEKGNAKTGN
ncbi:MAG TPA: DUF433 domain-containing protein [Gemmataceae bacterium]